MTARPRLTIAILGLLLLGAALPALAHRHGGRGPGGMDHHRLEHLALRLQLSDGQREEMRRAFAEGAEAGAETRRALFEARRALGDAIHAATFDEGAIRAAAAAVAALEADLAVERAQRAQRVRQILTPEQLVELDRLHAERREHHGLRGRGPGGPPPPGE